MNIENLVCEYMDEDGLRQKYDLQPDDLIEVARYEASFSYSQAPGEFIEMSVRDAIDNDQFNTCRGTIRVSARIKFLDGSVGSIWAES